MKIVSHGEIKISSNRKDLTIVHKLANAPLVFGFAQPWTSCVPRSLQSLRPKEGRCFKCKEEKKDYVRVGYHKTADFAESHKLNSQGKEIPRCRKQRNSCERIPCLIRVG